jgi:hypothetical protein
VGKVKVSARFQGFLDGSSLMQQRNVPWSQDPDEAAAATRLAEKLDVKPHRKDGALIVDIEAPEARVLYSYAESMVTAAGDNLGPWADEDRSNLAEVNTGRATMRALEKLFGAEGWY